MQNTSEHAESCLWCVMCHTIISTSLTFENHIIQYRWKNITFQINRMATCLGVAFVSSRFNFRLLFLTFFSHGGKDPKVFLVEKWSKTSFIPRQRPEHSNIFISMIKSRVGFSSISFTRGKEGRKRKMLYLKYFIFFLNISDILDFLLVLTVQRQWY